MHLTQSNILRLVGNPIQKYWEISLNIVFLPSLCVWLLCHLTKNKNGSILNMHFYSYQFRRACSIHTVVSVAVNNNNNNNNIIHNYNEIIVIKQNCSCLNNYIINFPSLCRTYIYMRELMIMHGILLHQDCFFSLYYKGCLIIVKNVFIQVILDKVYLSTLCRDEAPKPTTALDYTFGRRAKAGHNIVSKVLFSTLFLLFLSKGTLTR